MQMTSKIVLTNIGLALLVGFFSLKTYQIWTAEPMSLTTAAKAGIQPTSGRRSDSAARNRTASRSPASKTRYKNVTEKNLFVAERSASQLNDPAIEAVVESTTLRIDGKKIVLYGVVILEDRVSALISDPDVKNRKRATRWINTGDQIGQYTVASIAKQHVIFSEGGTKFKVALWDQTRDRQVDTGVGQKTPTVVKTDPSPSVPNESTPTQATAVKAREKKPAPDEGPRVIQTPFGEIKRKK